MPTPLTVAAIDAGSNAIRISIASAAGPNEIIPIFTERVPVRLGHNAFTRSELDPAVIEEAVAAFARFRSLFEQHHVTHYRAVATSAVRNASNRESLVHRLYHDTNIELEIIDGLEEARLVRMAVLWSTANQSLPRTIVDLGGGSLELTVRNGEWSTASMKIGTVRLLETFGISGAISADEARLLRKYCGSLVQSSCPLDEIEPGEKTIACGGNAESLAALFGETRDGVLVLPQVSLEQALAKLLKADVDKRMAKYGLRRDRAEVIGVAGVVLATLLDKLKVDHYVVPGVGLREGVLLDLAEIHLRHAPAGRSGKRVLLAAARGFATRIGHDITHGEQVRRLSKILFESLAELHGLPRSCLTALEVAALLHDVGEVVHRRGHHRHGEYLILNGRIPGLDSPNREIVAATVRAHRKSMPFAPKHLTYSKLDEQQQHQVQMLAALLRLADAFDTDHRQRVVDIRPNIRNKKILFEVDAEQAVEETSALAERKSAELAAALGYRLEFTVNVVAPAHLHSATRSE